MMMTAWAIALAVCFVAAFASLVPVLKAAFGKVGIKNEF
jgi:hypothetical protein